MQEEGGRASDERGERDNETLQAVREVGSERMPSTESDIHCVSIIGQVEGHLNLPPQNKTTRYEHILPMLVAIEENPGIKGFLVLMNTVGGDVEAGLALAEMIASMRKPSVSLVLGGGHSIGVPLAVAARRSFIVPTATMTIHPIRLTGMIVGVPQSVDYVIRMQERIVRFVTAHSSVTREELTRMMMHSGDMLGDIGSILVGEEAVSCGLIDEVGGLAQALACLRAFIAEAA